MRPNKIYNHKYSPNRTMYCYSWSGANVKSLSCKTCFFMSNLYIEFHTNLSFKGSESHEQLTLNLFSIQIHNRFPKWSIIVNTGSHTRGWRSVFKNNVISKAVAKDSSPAYAKFHASWRSLALVSSGILVRSGLWRYFDKSIQFSAS